MAVMAEKELRVACTSSYALIWELEPFGILSHTVFDYSKSIELHVVLQMSSCANLFINQMLQLKNIFVEIFFFASF